MDSPVADKQLDCEPETPPCPIRLQLSKEIFAYRLRHGITTTGDYQRYAHGCSARLSRYRASLADRSHHPNRYRTPKPAKPVRKSTKIQLRIKWLEAERAWARGMHIRSQLSAGNSSAGVSRSDKRLARNRFRRCFHYASNLSQFCETERVDRLTLLDVQAYTSVAEAEYLMESKEWEAASDALLKAKARYRQLWRLDDAEEAKLRLEGVEASLRICRYRSRDTRAADRVADGMPDQLAETWARAAREMPPSGEAEERQAVRRRGLAILPPTLRVREAIGAISAALAADRMRQRAVKDKFSEVNSEEINKRYSRILDAFANGMQAIRQELVEREPDCEEWDVWSALGVAIAEQTAAVEVEALFLQVAVYLSKLSLQGVPSFNVSGQTRQRTNQWSQITDSLLKSIQKLSTKLAPDFDVDDPSDAPSVPLLFLDSLRSAAVDLRSVLLIHALATADRKEDAFALANHLVSKPSLVVCDESFPEYGNMAALVTSLHSTLVAPEAQKLQMQLLATLTHRHSRTFDVSRYTTSRGETPRLLEENAPLSAPRSLPLKPIFLDLTLLNYSVDFSSDAAKPTGLIGRLASWWS